MNGVQCHKLLWWTVHEPTAPELQPDIVLRDRFDQGRQVNILARKKFPGGVLIAPGEQAQRVAETRSAMESDAPAIFEAAFIADDLFVASDVLLRDGDGWVLIEVKQSNSAKEEHNIDVAAQLHVLRQSGITVHRAEVMHLNKDFRHPDVGDLFARTDVTEDVEALVDDVGGQILEQVAALKGKLPVIPLGLQCWDPRECPFFDRCWPEDRDHIRRLYRARKKDSVQRMNEGIKSITQLPATTKLSDIQKRQLKAIQAGKVVVEPTLKAAIRPLNEVKLGHLDFETINRAVPVWDGLGPWEPAVVQWSYHEEDGKGGYQHDAYLAEGPGDPRAELAERMLEATQHAERIVMYTTFERSRIKDLAEQVPSLARDLDRLSAKLFDLAPVMRENVYHPDFNGSFSLKDILNPLVPDLTYNDLVIMDGLVASVEIARLLFVVQAVKERDQLRKDLLAYCERDTQATCRLVERLRELAS